MNWLPGGGVRHDFHMVVDGTDWAVIEDNMRELVRDNFYDEEGVLVPERAVNVKHWEVVDNEGDDWETTVSGWAVIAG